MFCTNCGAQFNGNFCPKCGQKTQSPNPTPSRSGNAHKYYDSDGELIDLSVIYGVYKTKTLITAFFERCTNYSQTEIQQIIKYMIENIQPPKYGAIESSKIQRRIESNLKWDQKLATPLQYIITACILVACLIFVFFFIGRPSTPTQPPNAATSAAEETEKQNLVTLEQFNKIEAGMAYQTVVDIFGGVDGELNSEVNIGDPKYKTQMYTWTAPDSIGGNCNVTFQGGKMTAKAQFGLE